MNLTVRSGNCLQRGLWGLFVIGLAIALIFTTQLAHGVTTVSAALSATANSQNAGTYAMQPITGSSSTTPIVMLTLSRDHQLHYKAYNDFSDLRPNGDGTVVQTTYTGSIDYYGYFDSQKCYIYSTANNRF